MLPHGASTLKCWFCLFGSISEIIDDLNSHSEEEVIQLIENVGKGYIKEKSRRSCSRF
jgi:hypothetical protein